MKTIHARLIFLLLLLLIGVPAAFSEIDTTALLTQSDQVLRGNSHEMTVTMDVKTKNWQRHYQLKVWMKGVDFSFARVLEPAKSGGQGFLRIKARLWNYLPSAERTILIPPSMMLDQFMGSDFSNDDFVKLSYLPRDYESTLVAEEKMSGFPVYHLLLNPKPDAPVTYGKLESWVRVSDAAPVRMDFYNEDLELIRTLHYSEFKNFHGHEVPSVWKMENHREPERTTTITVLDASYNIDIPDSLFTREELEEYHP
jgi:outer membrane lipoprotein-sorting protein